jgi:hypothetical protein
MRHWPLSNGQGPSKEAEGAAVESVGTCLPSARFGDVRRRLCSDRRSGQGARAQAGAGAEAVEDAAAPGPRADGDDAGPDDDDERDEHEQLEQPEELELPRVELADGDARLPACASLTAGG